VLTIYSKREGERERVEEIGRVRVLKRGIKINHPERAYLSSNHHPSFIIPLYISIMLDKVVRSRLRDR
jgi:hypothetical protein